MIGSDSSADIDRMIGSVKENLVANPEYADLHNQLGLLYTLQKNYDDACEHFQRGLMINPYYLETRLNLAFVHIERRKWPEAELELKECIEIEPGDGLSHHTLGVVFLAQGNKIRAVESLEAAARIDSFFRHLYEKLGVLRGGESRLTARAQKS